ncbi:MAG: type II 3-dehydroquinate dehydratase [Clostridia bacterium]|nr:type II 3-dehydroquinate dehydratase [Clostridia bacterium]
MKFLVINGVNLNLTGTREKSVYGGETLDELNAKIAAYAAKQGDEISFYQNNVEGELVNKLHAAKAEGYDGILLNAGAYTHYSYAIRDAVAAISVPVAEVHISNVFAREEFRKESVLSPVCRGTVFGFGVGSYIAALEGLRTVLQ